MDDNEILDLYWARSEAAIEETAKKYSRYCHYISYNILCDNGDAEECVNDTYLRAWNAIPPKRPNNLAAFLGKITRNLSLNKYKQRSAKRRGMGQIELVLAELEDCIPSLAGVEDAVDEMLLVESINHFLAALPQIKRRIFIRRYWYMSSIREISQQYGISESKVKTILWRMRKQLKAKLEMEGIVL